MRCLNKSTGINAERKSNAAITVAVVLLTGMILMFFIGTAYGYPTCTFIGYVHDKNGNLVGVGMPVNLSGPSYTGSALTKDTSKYYITIGLPAQCNEGDSVTITSRNTSNDYWGRVDITVGAVATMLNNITQNLSGMPSIRISSPSNDTYNVNNVSLNYSTSDPNNNRESCWYSLDGGNNTTLAGCVNATLSSLSDGSHNVTVYVNDTVGNMNSSTVHFSVDTTAPTVTPSSPVDNYNSSSRTVGFKFTVTDNLNGTTSCVLYVGGVEAGSNSSVVNNTLTTIQNTSVPVGSSTWYVNCSDGVNTGKSAGRTVNVDVTSPTVSITYPANRSYYNVTYFNFTVSEITDLCWYSVDGGSNSTPAACQNSTAVSLTEGAKTLKVYANDSANNTGGDSVSFTLDQTGPGISFVSPTPNNEIVTTSHTYINLTISEPGYCLLEWNGTNGSMSNISNNYYLNKTTLNDGNYTFSAWCNDTLGNLNQCESRWVYINRTYPDTTPPQITITSPENKSYNTKTIYLNWSADTEVNWSAYSVNGGENVSFLVNATYYEENSTTYKCAGEWYGSYPCSNTHDSNWSTYGAVDIPVGQPETGWIEINYTKPGNAMRATWREKEGTNGGNEEEHNLTIPANCFSQEVLQLNVTVKKYQNPSWVYSVRWECWNDTGWHSLKYNKDVAELPNFYEEGVWWYFYPNITAVEGQNNVTVWANDTVGNMNSSTMFFTVDLTKPDITIDTPSNGTYCNYDDYPFYINGTCTDSGTGVSTIYTNSTIWSAYDTESPFNISNSSAVSDGIYTVRVYCNDTAGNTNYADVTITYDETPPTISLTSPSNGSVLSQTWINITGTAADDNYDKVYINDTNFGSNLGSYTNWNFTNTSISEGVHNLLITANDSAGNTNSMEVSFTIDRTPPVVMDVSIVPDVIGPNASTTTSVLALALVSDAASSVNQVRLVFYNATQFNNSYNYTLNASMSNKGDYWAYSSDTGILQTGNEGRFYFNLTVVDSLGNANTTHGGYVTFNSSNGAEKTYLNASVSSDADNKTIVNSTGTTNTTMEIKTNQSITNASVGMALYSENPKSADAGFTALGKYLEIEVSPDITNALSWVMIKIYYTDDELSDAGIDDEGNLLMHYWNETLSDWEVCANTGVNETENYVWANLTHLSIFGIFEETPSPAAPRPTRKRVTGGYTTPSVCEEDWTCALWSPCSPDGTQSRVCTDLNSCGTEESRPAEKRSCTYVPSAPPCTEDWTCALWSPCSPDGTQTRTCVERNNCGTAEDKPSERRSCTYVEPRPPVPPSPAIPLAMPALILVIVAAVMIAVFVIRKRRNGKHKGM